MKRIGLVALLAASACNAPVAAGGILLRGAWGSDQGRLLANELNVQWSGACGSGTTADPIMLDKHGRFDLQGSYTPAGATPRPAQFQGAPSKGRMTLTIVLSEAEKVGPLELTLNDNTPTRVCR